MNTINWKNGINCSWFIVSCDVVKGFYITLGKNLLNIIPTQKSWNNVLTFMQLSFWHNLGMFLPYLSSLCNDICLPVCCIIWTSTEEKCSTAPRSKPWVLFHRQSSTGIFFLDFIRCCWCYTYLSNNYFDEKGSLHALLQSKKAWDKHCRWSYAVLVLHSQHQ